jgi:hypothetical protein
VLHLVQQGVDRRDPVRIEAVLGVAYVEDEDVVLTVERGHVAPS